ncbi:MAG: uncharacterized protein K0S76_2209 [Herbinix sp.]|jgi:hypothetical protein|nr:uncharacterized protein [Herbinix sp.]
MNCHDDQNKKCNPIKKTFHLILCCGLPILIVFLLPFIAKLSPAAAGFFGTIAPFICPVMMIGMMVVMHRNNKKVQEDAQVSNQIKKVE